MSKIKERIAREWKRYDRITNLIEGLEEDIANESNINTIKNHIQEIEFYKKDRLEVSIAIDTLEWTLRVLKEGEQK